jgi:hypothetical protein
MECFGILFSFPMSFVATAVYSFILRRVISRWSKMSNHLFWLSCVPLSLLILEFVGVVTIGTLSLRSNIGPAFYPIHSIIFFLTVPALANIMQIQKRFPFLAKWYITALICAFVSVGIVILQYGVSEALYGINGTDGPYS